MSLPTLSAQQARRIAVRAQLLDERPPASLVEVVDLLNGVQVDLTRAVEHSAELVLWARLGSDFTPEALDDLRNSGSIVEFQAHLHSSEGIRLLGADMALWPGREPRRPWQDEVEAWVEANAAARLELLSLLRQDGPLSARELPDECVVDWRSSGWSNNKNVVKMLECLEARGEVAVASREGRERRWDLAERILPDLEPPAHEEAHRLMASRRLRAGGILRPRALGAYLEPYDLTGIGVPVRVDGARGVWRVHEEYLGDDSFVGRAAVLSPLDRLVFDRARASDLFDFDYQLEMYKPAETRLWGYWAMPILMGENLVGKLDASADRDAGVLHVDRVHEDFDWDRRTRSAVDAEIRVLADWLQLELVRADA